MRTADEDTASIADSALAESEASELTVESDGSDSDEDNDEDDEDDDSKTPDLKEDQTEMVKQEHVQTSDPVKTEDTEATDPVKTEDAEANDAVKTEDAEANDVVKTEDTESSTTNRKGSPPPESTTGVSLDKSDDDSSDEPCFPDTSIQLQHVKGDK